MNIRAKTLNTHFHTFSIDFWFGDKTNRFCPPLFVNFTIIYYSFTCSLVEYAIVANRQISGSRLQIAYPSI